MYSDLQNTTEKSTDWEARSPLKIEGELRRCGRVNNSSSSSGTRRVDNGQ